MGQYWKKSFEVLGIILALTISYFELKEVIPTDPIIILEVDKLKTPRDMPEYVLTGVTADQDYVLKSVRLFPYSSNPVKRAIFQYDKYANDVDLIEITTAKPHSFLVSKELLQKTFDEDNSFAFELLDDNRFIFYFQFEGIEKQKTKFECRILTVDNHSVPCEIREKGYISLFRGIPWYFSAVIGGILLIVLIEVIDIFLRRGHKKTRRQRGGKAPNKAKNRLTIDND
jgi:hypothetical protein